MHGFFWLNFLAATTFLCTCWYLSESNNRKPLSYCLMLISIMLAIQTQLSLELLQQNIEEIALRSSGNAARSGCLNIQVRRKMVQNQDSWSTRDESSHSERPLRCRKNLEHQVVADVFTLTAQRCSEILWELWDVNAAETEDCLMLVLSSHPWLVNFITWKVHETDRHC